MAPGPTRGPSQDGPTEPRRRSVLGGNDDPFPSAFGPTGSTARSTGATGSSNAEGAEPGEATEGVTRPVARSLEGKKEPKRRKTGWHRIVDYPRQYKKGWRHWIPSWRLILGLFLTGMASVVLVLVVWYARIAIPTPDDFVEAQTTTVYYSDGVTVMGTFGETNRVIVEGDQIPDLVRQAVVAAEDRSFYENPGINPTGIARALWQNLRGGGHQQGGSSITQQYVERYYVGRTTVGMKGKLEEAMLAVKLARVEDKDDILTNYLNTIYFGRDSYGVETAARAYFGVGVADLTVTQAALIAGVIPSPNNFDPRFSMENAQRRWNYVLDGMVLTGALTQAERDAQVFPETIAFAPAQVYAGTQGYLLDMVRREVVSDSGITETELDQRGYRIVTTIDPTLQQMAVDAVNTLPTEGRAPNLRVGLVTLERGTSAILAVYGGPDFLTISRNAVTQDSAQAGSTFKPFTLVSYLENGGSLRSTFSGKNRIDVEGFTDGARNFSDESFGTIDVLEATAKSVNAVYAQMNVEVGPDKTLETAIKAGVSEEGLRENYNVPSNVLGPAPVHPIDMAEAYNTFSDQGMHTEPFIVRTIQYLNGDLAYQNSQVPQRVFEADVMADTTYALTQVVENAHGTGHHAQEVGFPVAGKTGTSNENRSAWFVGYSMYMTTAVAMYQVGPDGSQETITGFDGIKYVTGGTFPVDIWTEFMTRAHEGREALAFPPRADVGKSNTPSMVSVPSVVGMSEADATATLQGAGLGVAVQQASDPNVPQGTVASQDPAGGGEIEEGATVTIVVSQGSGEIAAPNVVGRTQSDATKRLGDAGFQVAVQEASSATVPEGNVISQNPAQAAPGGTVTIVVSTGPEDHPEPSPTPSPTITAALPPNAGNGRGGG